MCVMCSMDSLIYVNLGCTFTHRTLVSRVKGGFVLPQDFGLSLVTTLLPGFSEQVRVMLLPGFGEQARVVTCGS